MRILVTDGMDKTALAQLKAMAMMWWSSSMSPMPWAPR